MQEYEQIFGGILFIPRLRPKRLDGTGPKTITLPNFYMDLGPALLVFLSSRVQLVQT